MSDRSTAGKFVQHDGALPDEDDVALVMELTRNAYARSGLPTRDPRKSWSYWPDDEWETAVRYLLATPEDFLRADEPPPTPRCTVREAASLLLSKAARHAADAVELLGSYAYRKRDTYLPDGPFVTEEDVENARSAYQPPTTEEESP